MFARLASAALLAATCSPTPVSRAPEPPAAIEVQGHRGARGLRPENTPAGFALAHALHVTLELDLHLSADDRLVVWHDPEITPAKCRVDTAIRVRTMSMAELRNVVCDRNPEPERFPEQTAPDGEDFRLTELSEVLALPGARFNIELKRDPDDPDAIGDGFNGVDASTFERALVDAVREAGVVDHVVVQSFDHRVLWAIRTLEPRLTLAALTVAVPDLAALAARGASIWSPSHTILTADNVERAHQLGLTVIPWTVNAGADIRRVAELGVDGIISDRPDRVLEILAVAR